MSSTTKSQSIMSKSRSFEKTGAPPDLALFGSLYNSCDPDVSESLIFSIFRLIDSTPKYEQESQIFINQVKSKLIFVHECNCQVANLTGKYPKTKHYDDLLIRYIELEYDALYTKDAFPSRARESVTEDRVYSLIKTLLHKPVFEKNTKMAEHSDNVLKKSILILFSKICRKYLRADRFVASIIKKLNQFNIGNDYEVDNLLQLRLQLNYASAKRGTTTSDYGTDDSDSDCDNRLKIFSGRPKTNNYELKEISEKIESNFIVIGSDDDEPLPRVPNVTKSQKKKKLKDTRAKVNPVVTFEILDDDDEERTDNVNYMVYLQNEVVTNSKKCNGVYKTIEILSDDDDETEFKRKNDKLSICNEENVEERVHLVKCTKEFNRLPIKSTARSNVKSCIYNSKNENIEETIESENSEVPVFTNIKLPERLLKRTNNFNKELEKRVVKAELKGKKDLYKFKEETIESNINLIRKIDNRLNNVEQAPVKCLHNKLENKTKVRTQCNLINAVKENNVCIESNNLEIILQNITENSKVITNETKVCTEQSEGNNMQHLPTDNYLQFQDTQESNVNNDHIINRETIQSVNSICQKQDTKEEVIFTIPSKEIIYGNYCFETIPIFQHTDSLKQIDSFFIFADPISNNQLNLIYKTDVIDVTLRNNQETQESSADLTTNNFELSVIEEEMFNPVLAPGIKRELDCKNSIDTSDPLLISYFVPTDYFTSLDDEFNEIPNISNLVTDFYDLDIEHLDKINDIADTKKRKNEDRFQTRKKKAKEISEPLIDFTNTYR